MLRLNQVGFSNSRPRKVLFNILFLGGFTSNLSVNQCLIKPIFFLIQFFMTTIGRGGDITRPLFQEKIAPGVEVYGKRQVLNPISYFESCCKSSEQHFLKYDFGCNTFCFARIYPMGQFFPKKWPRDVISPPYGVNNK